MHGGGVEQGVRKGPAKRQMSREELIEWVLAAQPGARLCYGHGEHATHIASEEFNAELLKLESQGYIYLFHGKPELGRHSHDYIAQRSSRQVKA
ncbi:hypothetical protein NUH86_01620 [Sphingobium sp. JS3065]|uniref:hypothetical protein n=1 Tax=Sphingobium sp. JS3065 TaxID=2970925 RepID=UPI00226467B8|nr:hypothetical protein [Sphingobium sp. JS3065]UZW55529.1 hypothetical protein NUH86_01620 [Sphingobium sp. JS3065]